MARAAEILTAALRARLEEQEAKPATINHMLAAVRGVIREAWRLDLVDAPGQGTLARVVVDLLIAMSCDGGDAAMGGIDDTIREDTLGLKVPRRWRRPFTGGDYHHGWLVATSAAGVIYGFALLVGLGGPSTAPPSG